MLIIYKTANYQEQNPTLFILYIVSMIHDILKFSVSNGMGQLFTEEKLQVNFKKLTEYVQLQVNTLTPFQFSF